MSEVTATDRELEDSVRLNTFGRKVFDHRAYELKVAAMSPDSLAEVIRQCAVVLEQWENHPNRHYYLTEIAYCRGEQAKRDAKAACFANAGGSHADLKRGAMEFASKLRFYCPRFRGVE